MTQPDIHDDGFRVTELGAFRWRVDPMHEAVAVRAIRRRWKRESGMVGGITFLRDEQLRNEIMGDASGPCLPVLRDPSRTSRLGASRGITIAGRR